MSDAIHVDVWSDVACPWCYIGKRRLEAGIEAFAREPDAPSVTVEYHSFQLSPDTPEEVDGSAAAFLARHAGIPEDEARRMQAHVAAIASEVGLAYDFDAQRPANTRKAHELLHLAKARGVQLDAKERLLRAHFVEGRHVGRDEELAALGSEVGLDPDEVLAVLREGTYRAAVQADIYEARRLGISGVPFAVLDGRYGVSGAQPAEAFTRALQQAHAGRLSSPRR